MSFLLLSFFGLVFMWSYIAGPVYCPSFFEYQFVVFFCLRSSYLVKMRQDQGQGQEQNTDRDKSASVFIAVTAHLSLSLSLYFARVSQPLLSTFAITVCGVPSRLEVILLYCDWRNDVEVGLKGWKLNHCGTACGREGHSM
jgi:hypothetical protein